MVKLEKTLYVKKKNHNFIDPPSHACLFGHLKGKSLDLVIYVGSSLSIEGSVFNGDTSYVY